MYDKSNTLIIVISIKMKAEDPFIRKCCGNNNNWVLAYSDGNEVWKCKNDMTIDNGDDFCFLLINQCSICNTAENIVKIIGQNNRQNIIVWPHKSVVNGYGSITQEQFRKVLNNKKKLLLFEPFSHIGASEFENLLKNLPEKFDAAFKGLIELSIKKKHSPHLLALYILCQGYLAAHGGEGLSGWDKVPDEVKNAVQKKVDQAKLKSWWTDVLPNKETIEAELNYINAEENNKQDVKNLITAIYGNGDTLPNGSLVENAYSALKSILQGK